MVQTSWQPLLLTVNLKSLRVEMCVWVRMCVGVHAGVCVCVCVAEERGGSSPRWEAWRSTIRGSMAGSLHFLKTSSESLCVMWASEPRAPRGHRWATRQGQKVRVWLIAMWREKHGTRPCDETKLNKSRDECDPDLQLVPRQCCFN